MSIWCQAAERTEPARRPPLPATSTGQPGWRGLLWTWARCAPLQVPCAGLGLKAPLAVRQGGLHPALRAFWRPAGHTLGGRPEGPAPVPRACQQSGHSCPSCPCHWYPVTPLPPGVSHLCACSRGGQAGLWASSTPSRYTRPRGQLHAQQVLVFTLALASASQRAAASSGCNQAGAGGCGDWQAGSSSRCPWTGALCPAWQMLPENLRELSTVITCTMSVLCVLLYYGPLVS